MPRKKRILGVSIRSNAWVTDNFDFCSGGLLSCRIASRIHKRPSARSMPIKGGRWVAILKTGTNKSNDSPAIRIIRESRWSPLFSSCFLNSNSSFLNRGLKKSKGTKHTRILGMNSCRIMLIAEICPPIQSIVVVTSPKGEKAPPALAAIMIIPTNQRRSSLCDKIFAVREVITMAVVRLSRTDEIKNVRMVMIQSSFTLLRVLI